MSSSRVALLLACLVAVGLACWAFSRSSASRSAASMQQAPKTLKARKPAPDFTLKDATGQAVKLSDYKGKVVLLNFWATWCGPCALEIPWFEQFEQQYKSRGFEVVGVSMDEDGWSAIKPFIAEHKVNYRILLGNDSVGELYGGVDSLPTTFIIDRDGHFAFPPHVGLAAKNEYLSEIQSLLGTPQTSAQLVRPLPLSAVIFPGAAK